MQKITPHLWFDTQAEAAAQYYTSVFPNSKIVSVSHYTEAGKETHGMQPGSVMTVAFELNGQQFLALNGGPLFKFNEAISFMISCEDQAEIDYYWEKLSAGGDLNAQQCGWLKDKFGLSWQVVPKSLGEIMSSPAAEKAMNAFMQMKKIDVATLEQAIQS